jgi:hypothetical protein
MLSYVHSGIGCPESAAAKGKEFNYFQTLKNSKYIFGIGRTQPDRYFTTPNLHSYLSICMVLSILFFEIRVGEN